MYGKHGLGRGYAKFSKAKGLVYRVHNAGLMPWGGWNNMWLVMTQNKF